MTTRILCGDVREQLKTLADESVHCVVTSPPYWGLRDYGIAGQLGMEPTFQQHVEIITEIFRDVKRVLRKDGTLWLNYGDSYATSVNGRSAADVKALGNDDRTFRDKPFSTVQGILKPKDLCGIPWRVAFALQADGWYLRADIIWSKPNPMPESVRDRPTKAHEYIFLLSKSPRYFYDAEAIAEAFADDRMGNPGEYKRTSQASKGANNDRQDTGFLNNGSGWNKDGGITTRNKRSVWEIATSPFPEAHFATFPPELPEICIKAGTSEKGCCGKCGKPWVRETERKFQIATDVSEYKAGRGVLNQKPMDASNSWQGFPRGTTAITTLGWSPACQCDGYSPKHEIDFHYPPIPCTVLDPFGGAGTTGLVADRLQRNAILIELNPEYAALAKRRIYGDAPMFADVETAL